MITATPETRVYKLFSILQSYAPTSKDAFMVTELFNEDVREQTDPLVAERHIVNALADGLNYGNWPWVVMK